MTQTLIALCAALLLDQLLGEPARWHPLVGYGRLAERTERIFNADRRWPATGAGAGAGIAGALALLLLLVPPTLIIALLVKYAPFPVLIETLVLYLTLGGRSLAQHADQVRHALATGKTQEARHFTSYLVSRDTSAMSERDMSGAVIESTLENGCDAVFAPLFWFVIGGAPAALFYRLANTLDAMWGYRTKRYVHFGRAAARLDDVLNFVPARLTALTYALTGRFKNAITCWRTQAPAWKSPNAGPVMSSGAGALMLQLGGPALYHGDLQQRPALGRGQIPQQSDIKRATRLLHRSIIVWTTATLLIFGGLSLA